MGGRHVVGQVLEATIGPERTRRLRRLERKGRTSLVRWLAPDGVTVRAGSDSATASAPVSAAAKPTSRWHPADPLVSLPPPKMSRHQMIALLHERLQPRTYLEVGVRNGASLELSRARTIGIDPAFRIDREIRCDVQLVRATSDDFFARPDAVNHFEGVPVDLAFIDGMHLSEFALRDFINVEPLMASTGVVIFDDVLPRNALEAARDRRTASWTGDVYKVVELLLRRRPDLVVLWVNTQPTGTAVVLNLDPTSHVLVDVYANEEPQLLRPDPQEPPREVMSRSVAVDAELLLESPAWGILVAARESGDHSRLDEAWELLRALPHG